MRTITSFLYLQCPAPPDFPHRHDNFPRYIVSLSKKYRVESRVESKITRTLYVFSTSALFIKIGSHTSLPGKPFLADIPQSRWAQFSSKGAYFDTLPVKSNKLLSIISAGFLYHYFGEPLLVTCWHLLKLFYFCSQICILLKKKLRSYKKICKMKNKTMTIKAYDVSLIFILSLIQSNLQIREFLKGVICEKWRHCRRAVQVNFLHQWVAHSK